MVSLIEEGGNDQNAQFIKWDKVVDSFYPRPRNEVDIKFAGYTRIKLYTVYPAGYNFVADLLFFSNFIHNKNAFFFTIHFRPEEAKQN